MVEIRGIQFEFDFADADCVEKYDVAAFKLKEAFSDKGRFMKLKPADAIREQCAVVENYLDEVLGAGTSEKVFGGKKNLMEHIEAVNDLTEGAKMSNKVINDFANKYTQRQNTYQNKK